MKKTLVYLSFATISLLFTACGEVGVNGNQKAVLGVNENNESGSISTSRDTSAELMKLEKTYNIEKGESIKPLSENPKIVIETNIKTGKTTATLLLGEAEILKNQ